MGTSWTNLGRVLLNLSLKMKAAICAVEACCPPRCTHRYRGALVLSLADGELEGTLDRIVRRRHRLTPRSTLYPALIRLR